MTTAIHRGPDFVHVTYSPDLRAVVLKWHDEYDEGPLVRDAVLAAVDYVNQHRVAQWFADISTSRRGLSNKDLAWVNGEEFRGAIMDSTLRKFVLMPPLPETGQDTSWLKSWEANTLANSGRDVQAKLTGDMGEIRAFFNAGPANADP